MKKIELKDITNETKTGTTLLMFKTDWCGDCQMSAPFIDDIEAKLKDKAKFVYVDADAADAWKNSGNEEFAITNVPTFIVYKDGKQTWRKDSFGTSDEIESQLK